MAKTEKITKWFQFIKRFDFKKLTPKRIIGCLAVLLIVVWSLSVIFRSSKSPTSINMTEKQYEQTMKTPTPQPSGHQASGQSAGQGGKTAGKSAGPGSTAQKPGSAPSGQPGVHKQPTTAPGQSKKTKPSTDGGAHTAKAPTAAKVSPTAEPRGVAFVEATIKPLKYELDDRWWGWRPNDLIKLTDNVSNYQLGVLEVTRRTAVALAERISRTGTTDAYDKNLEQAMNWFMVKSTSYWFPSAESKYREALKELQDYANMLKAGKGSFHIRADNLIPLLTSYEDLCGSCDENLVKQFQPDGSPVSFFIVDDYFYYAKGVAHTMETVLEAVQHDFRPTLESRNATELLHHAILSCRQAADIDPLIILNSDLGSLLANHRANMAAPISHARFYLSQLIKTLST
jgi:hypothetical protein